MCHTPIVIRATRALFQWFDDEIYPNIRGRHVRLMLLEKVLAQWQRLVAFRKAMNLLHQAMHVVSYRCTATALETTSKVGTFYKLFCLLSPWWTPRQYGARSCLIVVSNGFRCNPGHAASGNAACIASTSTPPHDHQNGMWRRHICSSPSIFCMT